MLGSALSIDRLRRRLGADFLAPDAVERGGILPTALNARRLGPFGDTHLWCLLVGRDAEHVARLRRRLAGAALFTC